MYCERDRPLRVVLEDDVRRFAFAEYSSFYIDGAGADYTLHLGAYSGTAGDALTDKSNVQKFFAKDQDKDTWGDNCAASYKGGGWFSSCYMAHWFGPYKFGCTTCASEVTASMR